MFKETAPDLVPQVLGGAADVCIEVRHVNELCDPGFSGGPGDLLRDAHKDILEAIVPLHTKRKNHV